MPIIDCPDKPCIKCGNTTFYTRNNGQRVGCKDCEMKRKAARRKKMSEHPDYSANNRRAGLKSKYGLTPEQADEMLAVQNGQCSSCQTSIEFDGTSRNACIDHNHATNEVRAILCWRCNIVLGVAQENPERLRALADYVENHNG